MAYSTRIPANEAAAQLQGWSAREDGLAITRRFQFTDFKEAFSWMTRVALEAERLDHHPEWFNVYRTVDVTLTTHDAGGTTDLDVALARYMDACAA